MGSHWAVAVGVAKALKVREIRHGRIVELRNMALRGATMEELEARCVQFKVAPGTAKSYIVEVVESLQKVVKK